MPINYKEYPPNWLTEIRPRILNRAGNKCEWCGVHNGAVIKRDGDDIRTPSPQEWDMIHSRIRHAHSNMTESLKHHGFTRVVLTIAHLKHDKENHDVKDEELAALCQRCHLRHDIAHHVDNRKYGRNWQGKQQLKLDI